jgi:hypothetical protein
VRRVEDREPAVLPGKEVPDGEAGLATADDDDVLVLEHQRTTSKVAIMPA